MAHPAVEPSLLEDRLGELGPGAVAACRDMPDAVRQLEELSHRRRQMADEGRASALVVDHGDLVALGTEREHGE